MFPTNQVPQEPDDQGEWESSGVWESDDSHCDIDISTYSEEG